MPRLMALIVPRRIVDRDAIVPQRTRARRPLEAHLDVDVCLVDVEEVVEEEVAFGAVEADNAARHGAVDPEGFPACGWVDADEWMGALEILRTKSGVRAV